MWAEWSYNTSQHSGTTKTPFEITSGKPPLTIPQYLNGTSNIVAVEDLLANRETILTELRRKLAKAQLTMKKFADNHRREVNFEVSDLVLVKLRPHRQTSVTDAPYSKLHNKFYGPFQVLEKLGPVAYKLQLPSGSKIHHVFHYSVLKPFHQDPSHPMPVATLPPYAEDNQPIITPLVILDTRWTTTAEPRREVLVQWQGLPADDTSWEDWRISKLTTTLRTRCF
jgi:hypothetical protein